MFLYGMSLMSGGLQKLAGDKMRSFMAKMTTNYFTCILTGIVVTAMDFNLATPLIEITDIRNAEQAEQAINDYRDVLRSQHLSNIEKASYPYETGSFYMDLINCMEKMGDFIINISQSVIEAKNV